jgi:hypothetical protein
MAYELPGLKITLTAGADLSSYQHHFVKITGANTVGLCTATTDIPVGVLQNAPTSGGAAEIMVSGITKLSSNAGITAGALLGTSTDGQAVTADPDGAAEAYYVGQALDTSTGAGGLISALINCASPVLTAGS